MKCEKLIKTAAVVALILFIAGAVRGDPEDRST